MYLIIYGILQSLASYSCSKSDGSYYIAVRNFYFFPALSDKIKESPERIHFRLMWVYSCDCRNESEP